MTSTTRSPARSGTALRTFLRSALRSGPRTLLTVAYALATYVFSMLVVAYAVGYFADVYVPKDIDQGTASSWPVAAAVDVFLLLLFAVQHTVMARPAFKRAWATVAEPAVERSTFVLVASGLLALLFWLSRPIDGHVWRVTGAPAVALFSLYGAGWVLVLASTYAVDHFDLFGLRQVYLRAGGVAYTPPTFTADGLYRRVRHPLMAGFVIVFWATPSMTAGHLLVAVASTGYILVGIAFEERDLVRSLGATYRDYAARVPALVPGTKRVRPSRGR